MSAMSCCPQGKSRQPSKEVSRPRTAVAVHMSDSNGGDIVQILQLLADIRQQGAPACRVYLEPYAGNA
eukprot:12896566-Prorocentrum_lima.AAC.1